MLYFLKKHPYMSSFCLILIGVLAYAFILQVSQEQFQEKLLNKELTDLYRKVEMPKLENVDAKKNVITEKDAFFYYEKAYKEIIKSPKVTDHTKIKQLIKQGSSKAEFNINYIESSSELLYEFNIFGIKKLEEPSEAREVRSVLFEINGYYKKTINDEIRNQKYDQSYADIADWMVFIQKAFAKNLESNNLEMQFTARFYLRMLVDVYGILKILNEKSPRYDEKTAGEIKKIIDSRKNLTENYLKALFAYRLYDIDTFLSDPRVMHRYRLKKYQINRLKIVEINKYLLEKKYLETRSKEAENEIINYLNSQGKVITRLTYSHVYMIDGIERYNKAWQERLEFQERMKRQEETATKILSLNQ